MQEMIDCEKQRSLEIQQKSTSTIQKLTRNFQVTMQEMKDSEKRKSFQIQQKLTSTNQKLTKNFQAITKKFNTYRKKFERYEIINLIFRSHYI